jgi:L-fucose dehydrogenase
MDLLLKDKVVVVTGGAKGIGAAIVTTLGDEGAFPVVIDRDIEAGRKQQEILRSAGVRSLLIAADLSQAENCPNAIEQTIREFGRLDALVNNAGVNDRVGLETGTPEQYIESLQRNLLHYYNMAHYALPHLKQSRGSILNISSKTALTGQGGTSGYASSKGAILALTREWATELVNYSIRVNAIVPGEVMTPLYQQWLGTFPNPQEKLKLITENIPFGKRMTTTEEIASMAAFLISPRAGHITGQHVFVDGGYVHLDRALS